MPSPAKWQAFLRFRFFLIRLLIGPPSAHALYPTQQVLGRTHVRQWPIRWFVLLGLLFLLQPVPHAQAQQAVIHYVYDDLGRLVGVVDPEGNAATYTYDAVGNILAIGRHNVTDTSRPVAITLVVPDRGALGDSVAIFGHGFSADPSQNTIAFTGATASVLFASPTSLNTTVPSGATTGPITVTTPLGAATSPTAFTVVGSVTISPTTIALYPTQTQAFTATVTPTSPLSWSVNGIVGGNATVGTVSQLGLYTAPTTALSPPVVTVTVTNMDHPTFTASASVVIAAKPDQILAHAVSVAFSPLPTTVNSLTALPVSVSIAAPAVTFLAAMPVSVTLQPVITSTTPSSGSRGATALAVVLTGAGFTGATNVTFELNRVTDTTLSATGLTVNADGTQATLSLAIASTATIGPRVVRITTPGRTSTPQGEVGNLFTVQ